jgi:UDP-N-acetyl-D-galactosamine dehydrogenase
MSAPDHQPLPALASCTVAVVGLGYVGLPLALAFARPGHDVRGGAWLTRRVIGFDINTKRLDELRSGHDRTNESDAEEIGSATLLTFTSDPQILAEADVFIVTVPTPIDAARRPDLSALHKASISVGQALKARALRQPSCRPVVIYESTVFPGATEDVCVPCLEQSSGLSFNQDFFCGYSPERINPGDREHRLTTVIKVTSGSTPAVADWVDAFYGSIIEAGTYKAASLRVAEAAKVIENTQRDLNIALVNELAIIFRKLGIDTLDVLEAAGTKWNFLPFRPGLVGGHCIGVDPYYLTHKAEEMGYHPQVVLAGRRINDGMGSWIVEQLILEMARRRLEIGGSRVLVLGLTFKENCPDLRNTRVVDIITTLRNYGIEPVVVDPWADPEEAEHEYGLQLHASPPEGESFAAVIAAVAHQQFRDFSPESWRALLRPQGVLMDLKGIVSRSLEPIRL